MTRRAAAGMAAFVSVIAAPGWAQTLTPISTGKETALTKHLAAEQPTVVVFFKPTSTLETAFVEDLRRAYADRPVGFQVIHLATGQEPVARQYEVRETPTALVYDRRGRLVARSSDAMLIRAAVEKAAGVPRIDWVEAGDPRLEKLARLLGGDEAARPIPAEALPGILRTMSLQPEYLALVEALARRAHFSDGFLPRRTKEMIATYVSALNKCRY